MNLPKIDAFVSATTTALRLHKVGRTGLLEHSDFRQLQSLEHRGWTIYKNSSGVTRAISPEGDMVLFDEKGDIVVTGPKKEIR